MENLDLNWLLCDNNKSMPVSANHVDLHIEEKLKVDRKKFEALIQVNNSDEENAEKFFGRVMNECPSVVITWPLKLKSGTKSKKDPHVKISGNQQMVKEAKNKVLEYLDPKRDKVTLKLDVDWTAHSHIIGKAGVSIQKVMDTTGCHIHFPDANRTNTTDKSNQVSIAGTAIGVNEARLAIRQLIPILITFNILFKLGVRPNLLQALNQLIQLVQQLTSTQITLRFGSPNAMIHQSVMVFVRGTYGKSTNLKLAIDMLSRFVSDHIVSDKICYNINTEISTQHHCFVLGNEAEKVKTIMQTSGAVITFPNLSYETNKDVIQTAHESLPNKTSVSISAFEVKAVLSALQLIQMSLPLSLTFDLKQDQHLEQTFADTLSNSFNISITVKAKPKQNTTSVWIKAAEKDAFKLFEARRRIIQFCERSSYASIWSPIGSDFPLWLESSLVLKSDIFEDECKIKKAFNRAPGAERFANVFITNV